MWKWQSVAKAGARSFGALVPVLNGTRVARCAKAGLASSAAAAPSAVRRVKVVMAVLSLATLRRRQPAPHDRN